MGKVKFKVISQDIILPQRTYSAQLIKFAIVGTLNVIVGYGIYLVLLFFGLNYLLANSIGFSLSMINATYWNNKYIFENDSKNGWWKFFLKTYVAYAGTGIVLGNVLLCVWIEMLGISLFWAPILNLLITFPINFILNKFWVYRS